MFQEADRLCTAVETLSKHEKNFVETQLVG